MFALLRSSNYYTYYQHILVLFLHRIEFQNFLNCPVITGQHYFRFVVGICG